MQQILSVWLNLEPKRRIIVIGATLFMFAAIIGLSRIATTPSMTLLYSGLDASTAGEVVQALEARGVTYEIRGGAIFVASSQRDELRMTLASDGLPANSSSGYELLDSLTGFGTTSQMFDAAYWRAKEGELARTIVSSPQIQTARVHIANPSSQPFKRQIAATASVTVTTNSGAVSSERAKSLRYLIASAVAGLSAEDVSVIDGRNGVVISGDDSESGAAQGTDREKELRQNIERLLEARVGAGRAVVEVSVENETDIESIIETKFDPDGRVAISTETEENSTSSTDSRGSAVTVASNLPDGDGANSGDSSSNNSEVRERINYEVSETRRELQRGPGAIKRLTVAVLVDGIRSPNADTQDVLWEPRSDTELEALRELVASTVGFDEARGDIITIKTMEFQPVVIEGTVVQSSLFSMSDLNVMTMIQLAFLSLVTVVLGVFVVRPIFASSNIELPAPLPSVGLPAPGSSTTSPIPQTIPVAELPNMGGGPPALTGEIDSGEFGLPTLGVVSDFDFGDDDFGISTDPVKRLKKLIEDRQEETVEILRGWMEDAEEGV
ncbi:flagellar basal-body MS-ring/collar protein FliF [Pacificibacter marinus]|uniref:Flagellar M-ring protein n=1 Tax=Pacificibacter marinus TaxID=658057 RepID=A0A1Y5SZ10_9RHOB|nr:flagellar basal-body MS-ring/collar protein FliF [Pacificibacter marinus]SEL05104.1 flagellar M-ring protein FliF [Pacificibacter marinus]SLN51594.1 Flagellar M-ring protein [Pacificibacter marinus]